MFTTSAYACDDGSSPMKLATIKRRDPGPRDVEIEIEFCGVCHSDIHTARSEWAGSLSPCVPGHEIIGRVGRVGSQVTRFKAGSLVYLEVEVGEPGIVPGAHCPQLLSTRHHRARGH